MITLQSCPVVHPFVLDGMLIVCVSCLIVHCPVLEDLQAAAANEDETDLPAFALDVRFFVLFTVSNNNTNFLLCVYYSLRENSQFLIRNACSICLRTNHRRMDKPGNTKLNAWLQLGSYETSMLLMVHMSLA